MGMPERSAASRRVIPAAMSASDVAAASAPARSVPVAMRRTVVTKRLQRNPNTPSLLGHSLYQICMSVLFLVMDARERSPWSDAVAAQIRAELAASGMTQGEAAKAAGMARATLNRIAQGSRVADVSQLDKLCRAWNIPLSEFMARAEQRVNGSTLDQPGEVR